MLSIEKIFDRVVASDDGECVVIKCISFEEMERIRSQLYRELRKLRDSHKELSKTLNISRKMEDDKWIVYLEKVPEITADRVVFFGKDGKVKPFEEEANGTSKSETVGGSKPKRKRGRKDTGSDSSEGKALKESKALTNT